LDGGSALLRSSPELESDRKFSTAIDTRFCFFGGGVREGERRGVALREGGAALADLDLDLLLLGPVLAVPPFLKAAMSWVASSSELMLATRIVWCDAFTVVVGVKWLYERMIEQLRCGAERLLDWMIWTTVPADRWR
jgi:hypothetical protein